MPTPVPRRRLAARATLAVARVTGAVHALGAGVTWLARHRRLPSRRAVRDFWAHVGGRHRAALGLHGEPRSPEEAYRLWMEREAATASTPSQAAARIAALGSRPRFSVVLPVHEVRLDWLDSCLASVRAQLYPDWELCICDDATRTPAIREHLAAAAAAEPRIRLVRRKENGHISRATNDAAALASGEFLVFLDHDDCLAPDCLLELAVAIDRQPDADLLYSDMDQLDPSGARANPMFKPGWSPELLLSLNYAAHVVAVRRSLAVAIGGCRVGFEGSQDYDLVLRASERARRIVHVPGILYHWRIHESGPIAGSSQFKPYAVTNARRALQEALDRRAIAGRVVPADWVPGGALPYFDIEFPDHGPAVTIVVPTRDRLDLLAPCIDSVVRRTSYRDYRILVVDNGSADPGMLGFLQALPAPHSAVRIPSGRGGFNFAWLNNQAVQHVTTPYVLFLNDDTEVLRPEWLSQMVGYAQFPGVGAVGARLQYPDGRLQHAGVILAGNGFPNHAFYGVPAEAISTHALDRIQRNCCAVTGACMLMPTELFRASGGFWESLPSNFNDADLCLRLLTAGHRIVFAPRAALVHHESQTRVNTVRRRERRNWLSRWAGFVDPYSNPNIDPDHPGWQIKVEGPGR